MAVFSDVDNCSLRCCIVYSFVAFTLLFLTLLFGFGSDWIFRRVRHGSGHGRAYGLKWNGGGKKTHSVL